MSLGKIYVREESVHDLLKAKGWLSKAAKSGHKEGAELLSVVEQIHFRKAAEYAAEQVGKQRRNVALKTGTGGFIAFSSYNKKTVLTHTR